MGGNILVNIKENKPVISEVKIQNDQIIVSGKNLDSVTLAKVGAHDFQIESKTSDKLILNAKSALSFLVGQTLNLVISNAQASATFPFTFELQNGQVTAAKLHHMNASTGDFLQFNGSSWEPASLSTNQVYVGTYNAASDTPNLSAGVAAAGTYYIVTTAGTQDLGTGSMNFDVGDWVISDGTNWSKVAVGTNTVSNFNGRTGGVVPLSGDYSWSMLTKAAGKLTGSKLQEIADVDITGIQDGDILIWNNSTSKWESGAQPSVSIPAGSISNTQIASGAVDSSKIVDGTIVNADISATAAIDQSKINGLTTALTGKEPSITAGTAAQYWSGTKSWQNLNPAVIGSTLTGFSSTTGAITAADTVLSAFNKLNGNLGTVAASQGNYVLKTGDTMSAPLAMGGNKITGLATPTAATDAATMAYVDSKASAASQWTTAGSNIHYNTGGVGVGTSTPEASFHAASPNYPPAIMERTSTTHTNARRAGLYVLASTTQDMVDGFGSHVDFGVRDNAGVNNMLGSVGALRSGADNSGSLYFITNNLGSSAIHMIIDNLGRTGLGVAAPTEKLEVAGNIALTGKIRMKSDTVNYVELQAPAGLASTLNFKLPSTAGTSGQALTTDGSGNLSWSTVSSGAIADGSIGYVKLNLADGDIPLAKLAGASDATKYLKGDKSWGTFITDVLASTFATVTPSNTAIANGDSLQAVANKTQGQINNLVSNSLNKTGADSVTGTITINPATGALKIPSTPSGVDLTDAANVQYVQNYVDTFGKWLKSGSNIYFSTGNVGIGSSSTTGPAGIEAQLKILRPLNKWGLMIEGDGTNQSDILLNTPNNSANNRVGQIVNGGDKFIFRALNDDMTQKTQLLTMLLNSGYVGVGTATPIRPFHVAQSAAAGGNIAPMLIQRVNTSGTPAANELTVIQFQIPNSAGTGVITADLGSTLTDVTPGSEKGALIFRTSPDGGSNIPERMRIDSAGNVAIGTTAPIADTAGRTYLSIKGATDTGVLELGSGSPDADQAIAGLVQWSDRNSVAADKRVVFMTGLLDGTTANNRGGAWRVATKADGANGLTERMRITSAGNVGIGTSTPQARLDLGLGTGGKFFWYDDDTSGVYAGTKGGIYLDQFSLSNNTTLSFPTAVGNPGTLIFASKNTSLSTSASLTPRMTIAGETGNVGIGTSTPTSNLSILSTNNINSGGNLAAGIGAVRIQDGTSIGLLLDSNQIEQIDPANYLYLNHNSAAMTIINYGGGNVGIGTLTPTYKLHVNGSVAGVGAYNALSDIRLKKDFERIPDALERVVSLNGFYYQWRQDENPELEFDKGRDMGVIAQEVEKQFPEAVKTDKNSGIKSVAYSKLIAPIIEAIKALFMESKSVKREIASIKADNKIKEEEILKLKQENAEMKARLDRMEKALLAK